MKRDIMQNANKLNNAKLNKSQCVRVFLLSDYCSSQYDFATCFSIECRFTESRGAQSFFSNLKVFIGYNKHTIFSKATQNKTIERARVQCHKFFTTVTYDRRRVSQLGSLQSILHCVTGVAYQTNALNYNCKIAYNIDPSARYYKTFFFAE